MPDFDGDNATENFDGPQSADLAPLPEFVGRYRICRVLGKGSFGVVYLAEDRQLDRLVALKVPLRLSTELAHIGSYIAEARVVARLRHPNIVAVHDIGSTENYPCFIVSQLIDGKPLSEEIKLRRFGVSEAVKLVIKVADALHYAHKQGFIHRDVKPSNILIDDAGEPYVVDFGLALREENVGKGPRYAGTPAYMSPEQIRGEGHRVDGRSDVFSLGVILYQLLVGKKPFRGEKKAELFEQVLTFEPRPLRQYNDEIPIELERICLRSLAKRASERYSAAKDFADDLRYFLQKITFADANAAAHAPQPSERLAGAEDGASSASGYSSLGGRSVKIVPKGLRPFDSHDADFFLELLPGPRDRDGLPDSVRFWKLLIEERDAQLTFPVGMIYGPSGCGKSSLVQAGLLPRLASDVVHIYIEATPDETAARILQGLRRNCSGLHDESGLVDAMTALRRGAGLHADKKVLIVIDQFEQWLHTCDDMRNSELVAALRQCDGTRLQSIVMVRDDFWMAASRFMAELEVDLHNGRNMRCADLFDVQHARKVLAALGRAFGTLPEDPNLISKDQKQFIGQAVHDLSKEGRVVSVRLAVFAEMMKGKPWTSATLKQVGGTHGIGVKFLEETFGQPTASPRARLHEHGCRAVLSALLPDAGTDIKVEMKSYAELLAASGYSDRPGAFQDLIKFLEGEVRLITPTDRAGLGSSKVLSSLSDTDHRYYQLTHDYLVVSLRAWLTRKQSETRRGRAELRLIERASLWSVKPEKRQLPSLLEFLSIVGLTRKESWSQSQQQMMHAARRAHAVRWGSVALLLLMIGFAAHWFSGVVRERNQLAQMISAVALMRNLRGTAIPLGVRELDEYPPELTIAELQGQFDQSDRDQRLALACALAHFGSVNVAYLVGQIGEASANEVDNLAEALEPSREDSLRAIRIARQAAAAAKDLRLQARLAVVAMHLGDFTLAGDMTEFENRPDPSERTVFIDEFAKWHGDPLRLASLGRSIESESLRSGLCLALGSIRADELTLATKQAWSPALEAWYREQPDSGTHSASSWVLARWARQAPLPNVAASKSDDQKNWYVNSIGMTMLGLPAGSFRTIVDGKRGTKVVVAKPFWICDREVSVGLFESYLDEASTDGQRDYRRTRLPKEHPVRYVSWIDAILFCNWLSEREGRPPRYRFSDGKWVVDSESKGYRLLSELEWEYACRAGTQTNFASGDDIDLLRAYAVFHDSQTSVCGEMLPNAWGLFDMHGNVWEWCDSSDGPYFRGGSYAMDSSFVRSVSRFDYSADDDMLSGGFRVARDR